MKTNEKSFGSPNGKRGWCNDTNPFNMMKGIQFKLIIAFLLPVCCIIVLGIVSYKKASSEIIKNYEEFMSQTLDMTGQYYSFSFNTIQENVNEYYQDVDMNDYYSGLFRISPTKEITFYNATLKEMKKEIWADKFIENLYILSDQQDSMITSNLKEDNLYTSFIDTQQGAVIAKDPSNYYWFGTNAEVDEILNTSSDSYAIRLIRKFDKSDTCIIADISRKEVMQILSRLDMGANSILGFVTYEGVEMLSLKEGDDEENRKEQEESVTGRENIFYDTYFYKEALTKEEDSGFQYVEYNQDSYMFIYSKIGETGSMICSLIPNEIIIGQAKDIKNITIIIVIIACILSMVICSKIAGGIGKTIKHITIQLKKVAQGDLSVKITTKRKDEFMILINDITDMISNMRSLIKKVKDVGEDLYAGANQVSETSKTFVDTSRDIQTSIGEIETGVTQLDENSADCLSQMDSLSEKIALVNDNTNEINTIADTTAKVISQGIQMMKELNDKTKSTTQITQQVIEMIKMLDKQSKIIADIVNVINEIAGQTNLLSLNASIESARAGTYGRGFAVVANEIRKLADQSLHAANQIQGIINEITKKTNEAVVTAEKAEVMIQLQEIAVGNTTDSFNTMNIQIDNLVNELSSILKNVDNMEQARVTTLDAIESISAVSEETTANSIVVSTNIEKQLNSVMQLDTASTNLLNRAKDLEDAINQFKMDE